jgi:hypothetical protein
MFKWAPDGIYDHLKYEVRYLISGGRQTIVISKLWLDKGGPEGVDSSLLVPWGTYPDMPPKPAK